MSMMFPGWQFRRTCREESWLCNTSKCGLPTDVIERSHGGHIFRRVPALKSWRIVPSSQEQKGLSFEER
jgi:hypothetical protein